MGILFSLLWIVLVVAYVRFRIGTGFQKSDVSITIAFLIFAASTFFEGEVFWQPTWNLCLKFLALALVIISIGQGKRKRDITDIEETKG